VLLQLHSRVPGGLHEPQCMSNNLCDHSHVNATQNPITALLLLCCCRSELVCWLVCLTYARTRIGQRCISIRSWLWYCGERTVGNDLGDMGSLEGKIFFVQAIFPTLSSCKATQAANVCWVAVVQSFETEIAALLSKPFVVVWCAPPAVLLSLCHKDITGGLSRFSSSRSRLTSSAEQQRVICAGSC
jgi:hypothetical protein